MIKQFLTEWLGIKNIYLEVIQHDAAIDVLENKIKDLETDISLIRKNYEILNIRTLSLSKSADLSKAGVEEQASKIVSVENSITQLEAQVKDLSKLANDAMAWSKVCEAKLNKLGEYKPECTKECKTKAVPKTNSLGSVRKTAPKTTKKSK